MGILKPQINGSLYINTEICTLAVDGWAVTFRTVRRGLGGLHATPAVVTSEIEASPHGHMGISISQNVSDEAVGQWRKRLCVCMKDIILNIC